MRAPRADTSTAPEPRHAASGPGEFGSRVEVDEAFRASSLAIDAQGVDLEPILAQFAREGYARLGPVLEPAAAARLVARSEELMLGRVVVPGLFFQHDTTTGNYDDLAFGRGYEGPSLGYRKLEKLERDPLFGGWLSNLLFERIARALLGDEVTLYRAVLMNKPASGGTDLPFHQDGGSFWGLDREPTLQLWTALDEVPESSGCLDVLGGSHHGGLVTPLGGIVPAARVAEAGAVERARALPARAGEVILLHNHVWHRSGRNVTGRARRAFSVCYLEGATRCTRKKRAPRRFVPVFRVPDVG